MNMMDCIFYSVYSCIIFVLLSYDIFKIYIGKSVLYNFWLCTIFECIVINCVLNEFYLGKWNILFMFVLVSF